MILCGKEFTTEEINQIQDIIAQNQDISRGKLSRLVCERLNWRSANGKLKEMRCRVALLRIQRQGHINLPPAQESRWLNFPKRCEGKHLSTCNAQAGKTGKRDAKYAMYSFFEDAEWKALVSFKTQNPIPPEKPPTLREAIRMVASLGGFLGRKCDGKPGTQALWLGLQRLDDITEMWKISMSVLAPHTLDPPIVSSNKCG